MLKYLRYKFAYLAKVIYRILRNICSTQTVRLLYLSGGLCKRLKVNLFIYSFTGNIVFFGWLDHRQRICSKFRRYSSFSQTRRYRSTWRKRLASLATVSPPTVSPNFTSAKWSSVLYYDKELYYTYLPRWATLLKFFSPNTSSKIVLSLVVF